MSPHFFSQLAKLRQANDGASPLLRFQSARQLWKSAPRSIRRTALRGLYTRIDPSKLPPPGSRPPRTHFCKTDRDIRVASNEIRRLISSDLLFPNPDPNCLIHPYFIVWKRGKSRLVIDFFLLNEAILMDPSVSYEDLTRVPHVVKRRYWMASVDLKSAFHHVPLSPMFQTLCSILFEGVVYSFRVLTFGVNIAPRTWCALLGYVLNLLRAPRHALRLIFYMDDILIVHRRRRTLYRHLLLLLTTLDQYGFVINWEKSILTPTRSLRHLGLIINSDTCSFQAPPDKIKDICLFIRHLTRKTHCRISSAQSLLGKLTAISLAFLPARRYSWRLSQEITHALPFPSCPRRILRRHRLSLSPLARQDLLWLAVNLPRSPSRSYLSPAPTHLLFSDASLTGWGAWCPQTGQAVYGFWPPAIRLNPPHIQILEMWALIYAIQHLRLPLLARLHVHVDNLAVLSYVKKWGGSQCLPLRDLTFRLWDLLAYRELSICQVSYIPSHLNVIPDTLSRLTPLPSL